jgi:hypothetical protein
VYVKIVQKMFGTRPKALRPAHQPLHRAAGHRDALALQMGVDADQMRTKPPVATVRPIRPR